MTQASNSVLASVCPLCASGAIAATGYAARDLDGVSRPVFECKACTGRFIANRPVFIAKVRASETDELDATILRDQAAYFDDKKPLDELDYPFSLLPLIQRYGSGDRILEMGCGASQLLPLLKAKGYRAEGFEGVNEIVHLARQRSVKVTKGDFDSIREVLNGAQFDVIISDQVFEHLLHPSHVLLQLTGLLAEGGTLIFRLPNEGSLRRRAELMLATLRGTKQPWCYFVDHWNYFNERALRMCFETSGFEVLRIKHDLSPQGFLMARLFRLKGLRTLLPRIVARVDSFVLSNGLTIIARPKSPSLDQAAVAAAKTAGFKPATRRP